MRRNRSFFMELSQIVLLADVVVGDFILLRRRGQRDGHQEFSAFAQFGMHFDFALHGAHDVLYNARPNPVPPMDRERPLSTR